MKHDSFITVLTLLTVVGIAGYAGCNSCYNYSGANKDKAEAEARIFAKELGMDLKGVVCNKHDSDGDGYVSCTFSLTDASVRTFECAGKNIIQDNTGCREPKLKMPGSVRVEQ